MMDLGRWDWLAFSEIWSRKHVKGFQTKNSIVGFFVFVSCIIFNYRSSAVIQYNLLKRCCEWILIQSWTQKIDYSLLLLTWHIRFRIGISNLSISGIMLHGRCYISHCFYFSAFSFLLFLWLFVGWSLFFGFVFMSLDSSLSYQESILTYLLSFWLIIKFYYYYGWIKLYYTVLFNCIIADYLILLCHFYVFSYFFYYSFFIFIFDLLLVLLSLFKFSLILCCIFCFLLYLRYCIYYHF